MNYCYRTCSTSLSLSDSRDKVQSNWTEVFSVPSSLSRGIFRSFVSARQNAESWEGGREGSLDLSWFSCPNETSDTPWFRRIRLSGLRKLSSCHSDLTIGFWQAIASQVVQRTQHPLEMKILFRVSPLCRNLPAREERNFRRAVERKPFSDEAEFFIRAHAYIHHLIVEANKETVIALSINIFSRQRFPAYRFSFVVTLFIIYSSIESLFDFRVGIQICIYIHIKFYENVWIQFTFYHILSRPPHRYQLWYLNKFA